MIPNHTILHKYTVFTASYEAPPPKKNVTQNHPASWMMNSYISWPLNMPKYFASWGHAVAQLVEALRYNPEDRGFDSRCHWNFSFT